MEQLTKKQFDRVCSDFMNYAKEPIEVSFCYGFFCVTGSKKALTNLIKKHEDNPRAYIENGMFFLSTTFRGKFETEMLS